MPFIAPPAPMQAEATRSAAQDQFAALLNNRLRTEAAQSIGNMLTQAAKLTPTTNHQQAAAQSLQALGGDLFALNAKLGNTPAQAARVNPNLRALAKDYQNLVRDAVQNDVDATGKDLEQLQTDLGKAVDSIGGVHGSSRDMVRQTLSDIGYLGASIRNEAGGAKRIDALAPGKTILVERAAANIQAFNEKPLADGNIAGLTRLGQQSARAILGGVASIAANTGLLGGAVDSAVAKLVQDSGRLGDDISMTYQSTKVASTLADVRTLNADAATVVSTLQAQTGGLYGNKGALLSLTANLDALGRQLVSQTRTR